MLIRFSTANYKSIKEELHLRMQAAAIKDEPGSLIETKRMNLLKASLVFGPNASGKSNLMDAVALMRWLVLNSARESQSTDDIEVEPFLLSTETEDKPSRFEMSFILNGTNYLYGFEANKKQITSEWLFAKTKGEKDYPLFLRKGKEINVWESRFKEGVGVEARTRDNALFLSVVAQWNGKIAGEIVNWFEKIKPMHGIRDERYWNITAGMVDNPEEKSLILDMMQKADLGIEDLEFVKSEMRWDEIVDTIPPELHEKFKEQMKTAKFGNVFTSHSKFNENLEKVSPVKFQLGTQESAGTQKFFNLIGAIIKSLSKGDILLIDELDSRLHTYLSQQIVYLFNDANTNRLDAQLIFTSHDTNLLENKLLRRDQINFIEKNEFGASQITPLISFKDTRKETPYQKKYLEGRYGAIPMLGDFQSIFSA